jgi:hypothetical protein
MCCFRPYWILIGLAGFALV